MKKLTIFAIACALVLGLTATNARADIALTPGDAYYLGFLHPPEPSSVADETTYINNLITVAAGASAVIDTRTYDRIISTLAGPFSTVSSTGVSQVTSGDSGISVTGTSYILGKYDGPNVGDYVWVVPTGTYSIPAALGPDPSNPFTNTNGLSHYDVFTGSSVPDGGVTLMLLGGVLVGLEHYAPEIQRVNKSFSPGENRERAGAIQPFFHFPTWFVNRAVAAFRPPDQLRNSI